MAEGGDPEDGKNPFSYGSFINNGKHNENGNENGVEDEVEPDLGIPRRREIPNGENEKSTNRRDENPFSFRQFLKKDHYASNAKPGHPIVGLTSHHSNGKDEATAGSSRVYPNNSAPDFTSGLPDFVQCHFILDGTHSESTNDAEVLPDFTLDNSARGHHNVRDNKANNHKKSHLTNARECHFDVSFKAGTVRSSAQSEGAVTSLPDFLSDGPMLSNVCERQKVEAQPSSKKSSKSHNVGDGRGRVNGEVSLDIALKNENEMLQRELTETRELLSRESKRVTELSHEIELLKKKDNEEVVALEMMVQQVETNMQGTTERATVAEATIAKLKQETKSLQIQLAAVMKENETLRSCESKRASVTEKAKQAAEQMRKAADTAQNQLMQLLTGVESLKLLATILTDIDKTNDINSKKENT